MIGNTPNKDGCSKAWGRLSNFIQYPVVAVLSTGHVGAATVVDYSSLFFESPYPIFVHAM
jgi:hypothetical protein